MKGGACPGRQRTTAATATATSTSTSSPASVSHRCNVCADTFDTKAQLILHSVRHIKEQVCCGQIGSLLGKWEAKSAFSRSQHRSPTASASGISSLLQQTPIPLSEIKREDAFPVSDNLLPRDAASIRGGTSPPQIRLPENDDSFCVQCQTPRSSCGHAATAPSSPSPVTAPPPPSPVTAPSPSPPLNTSSSSQKQWQCDICLKTFTTKYFLKKHNRLHTGLVIASGNYLISHKCNPFFICLQEKPPTPVICAAGPSHSNNRTTSTCSTTRMKNRTPGKDYSSHVENCGESRETKR